ncbi:hypothetical protein [Bradyrhizobium diazoefficiens]|uniref:hypothetical protein n=1 Tax=Bradyrhizobium diazoefficiens TaxID=1355477 RepID=UPI002714D952|nr:hypothetical protein [Bradyrhizobium diazoefficiens]WLC16635.1 hypothetical protein QIH76_42375 [Bradyrhizobium diazoefficiens]
MNRNLLAAFVLALAAIGASPALAAGEFDFLDPCIKARSDFADQRQQMRARAAEFEGSIATLVAGAEFRAAWMNAKREKARPIFDAEYSPTLRKLGVTDMDQAFDAWFADLMNSLPADELDDLINKSYRELAKEELAAIRTKTEAEFDEAKSELNGSCKKDVGSQVLRVVLAPIGWIGGNFESAKNEKNVVTQVFKSITGISPKDIAKQGILGGDKSELRKLANAVAGGEKSAIREGLRFFDPTNEKGILGGHDSVPHVVGRQIDQTLNPARWKW